MKNLRHIFLLATIFLVPLSLSAQNKGFQLPSKKRSTHSNFASIKSTGSKNASDLSSTRKGKPTSTMTKSDRDRIIQNIINNMVYIEGGSFTMGATVEQSSEAQESEWPAHRVTLSSFYIGEYEVTQAEWQAVMGNNPSHNKGSNLPVESVSWTDCQSFIRKLNTITGKRFRLPTEAEWEYAARGGRRSHGYKYAGTSNDLDAVAWFWRNSGDSYLYGEWDDGITSVNHCQTHNVGTKRPNELDLFDMVATFGSGVRTGTAITAAMHRPTPKVRFQVNIE